MLNNLKLKMKILLGKKIDNKNLPNNIVLKVHKNKEIQPN
jgi:hypothetical protein